MDLQEDTNAGFTSATTVYTGAALNYGVTGKGNGSYYYRVRASNAVGSSAWLPATNPCVVTLPPPAPATVTVPATSTGNFTVSWTAAPTAASYDLQEDTSNTFPAPTTVYSGANLSFGVTGKTSGTFYYRVRASNAGGNSGWTAGANGCQIVPPTPPSTIVVPATSSTGSFTVSWTASAGNPTYELWEANNALFAGAAQVYLGTNLSYNVTGKTGGTWWYEVRAIGPSGTSAWTVSTNGCQIIAPSAPATITVPASSASGNYTVSWAAVGSFSYFLQEDTSAAFSAPNTVYSGTNTSYNVTGKTSGTFWYRVCATNVVGNSPWTTSTNGCQIVPPSPPPTITVPATSMDGNFTVTWTAPAAGATAYDLEEDSSSAFSAPTTVYSGANLTFNVTGKTSGTWWYRVRATGVAGSSGWTASTNGCQIVPPNPPATVTVPATSATGIYTVSWTASTGATGYDLEEDTNAGFTAPTTVYTGSNLSYQVTGKTSGTFYYRARATSAVGARAVGRPGGTAARSFRRRRRHR
jgi:hypothetical protein